VTAWKETRIEVVRSECETHEELRESLKALRGSPVAVGEYPPRVEDSPDVISGYIPDYDGFARTRAY